MVPFAHIDNRVFSVREALGLGLRHFEHAHTLAVEVSTGDELRAADQRMLAALGSPPAGGFYLYAMEVLAGLGPRDPRMTRLIGELARAGATAIWSCSASRATSRSLPTGRGDTRRPASTRSGSRTAGSPSTGTRR
jgi:hypothetical protein